MLLSKSPGHRLLSRFSFQNSKQGNHPFPFFKFPIFSFSILEFVYINFRLYTLIFINLNENKMSSPFAHTALPRTLSRSPGSAESRTGGALSGVSGVLCSSPASSLSVSVQDTMARTKQTATKPRRRRTREVPASEVVREEDYEAAEQSTSDEDAPTTSSSSSNSGRDGENAASSPEQNNSAGETAEAQEGSGEEEEDLAEAYRQTVQKTVNPNPFKTRMKPGDLALLESGFEAFKEQHPFGEEWDIIVPPADAVLAWGDDIENADNYFVCYEAVIEAGLRFPLHRGIRKILKGYDLGVWQLTPNSWVNILSYIAACEFQDIEPSFTAFAHMHYLKSAPGGFGAWYTISTLPEYLMSLDKVSKWGGWKDKWYLVSSPSIRMNKILRRYNKEPALIGQKAVRPALTSNAREQIIEPEFFKTTTEPLGDGSQIVVPKNWIPHPDFFKDERFLSACGLSTMFPKGSSSYFPGSFFRLLFIFML